MEALSVEEKAKRLEEKLKQGKRVLDALHGAFESDGQVSKATTQAVIHLVETLLEVDDE